MQLKYQVHLSKWIPTDPIPNTAFKMADKVAVFEYKCFVQMFYPVQLKGQKTAPTPKAIPGHYSTIKMRTWGFRNL